MLGPARRLSNTGGRSPAVDLVPVRGDVELASVEHAENLAAILALPLACVIH